MKPSLMLLRPTGLAALLTGALTILLLAGCSTPVALADSRKPAAPTGSPEAARRLFAMARPITHTLAETYLRNRGITALGETGALRFHARCYYRPDQHEPTETWPAMIAAVTNLNGGITGAHRTWLDPCGRGKAPIDTPRRAMGDLLGHAVRFGVAHDVIAAGEGIETILSLRCVLPHMPMVAALSAAHLAATLFPVTRSWALLPAAAVFRFIATIAPTLLRSSSIPSASSKCSGKKTAPRATLRSTCKFSLRRLIA